MKAQQLKKILEGQLLDFFPPAQGQTVQCWAGFIYRLNGDCFECLNTTNTANPAQDANFERVNFDNFQDNSGNILLGE